MRNRPHLPRVAFSSLSATFVVVALTIGALGGCYHRVVGAEGVGSERYDVYEPNLKDPNDSAMPKRQTVPTQSIPTKRAPDQ